MASDSELRRALTQLEELLERHDSLERDWQALFERHPYILTDGLALGIQPEALIACKPGKSEADFYFYPNRSDYGISPYGVIEIKRPSTPLLKTPRKNVICLSADATAAVAQAQKYADELGAKVEHDSSSLVMLGNRNHVFVIAGLSNEFAEKITSELMAEQARRLLPTRCRLVPFDALARSLRSRTPPRLHVLFPSERVVDGRKYKPRRIPAEPGPKNFKPYRNRGGGGFVPRGGGFGGPRELWEVRCETCGDVVGTIPLYPLRPVFCRRCRENANS